MGAASLPVVGLGDPSRGPGARRPTAHGRTEGGAPGSRQGGRAARRSFTTAGAVLARVLARVRVERPSSVSPYSGWLPSRESRRSKDGSVLLLSFTRPGNSPCIVNSGVFLAAEVETPDDLMRKPLMKDGTAGIDQRYRTRIVFGGDLRDAVYSFESAEPAKEFVAQLSQQLAGPEQTLIDLDALARQCGWEPIEQPAQPAGTATAD